MTRTLGKEWKKVAIKLMGISVANGECIISADALKEACAMTYFCLPNNKDSDNYDSVTALVREEINEAVDNLMVCDLLRDENAKPLFCALEYYKNGSCDGFGTIKKCFVVNTDKSFEDFNEATQGIDEDVDFAMQDERTLGVLGISNYEGLNNHLGQKMSETEKNTIMEPRITL